MDVHGSFHLLPIYFQLLPSHLASIRLPFNFQEVDESFGSQMEVEWKPNGSFHSFTK